MTTIPVSDNLMDSHIMKFVIKGKPIRTDGLGVRCSPQQTYGVSEDSPDHFKGAKSLKGENGYIYKHDNPENAKKFDYFGQKKYYSIDGSG